jgi:hypothetical protein
MKFIKNYTGGKYGTIKNFLIFLALHPVIFILCLLPFIASGRNNDCIELFALCFIAIFFLDISYALATHNSLKNKNLREKILAILLTYGAIIIFGFLLYTNGIAGVATCYA